MNEGIAEHALEIASQSANYAEVRLEKVERNDIILRNGAIDIVGHMSDEGICVRVLTEDGIGFSSTNVLDNESVEKVVKEALKHARACRRVPPPRFSDEESVEDRWSVPEKYNLSKIGIEERLEDLLVAEELLPSLGNFPVRIFTVSDTQTKKLFLNSEGSCLRAYIPVVGCDYTLMAKEGTTMMYIFNRFGNTGGWEVFKTFNIVEDVEKKVKNAKELIKNGKKLRKGKMDIVAGPDVIGIVCHECCGHPSEADRILGREASQAGMSFINRDIQGTRIGSDILTVVDDPTVKGSYAYSVYDDEGVPTRRRFLIKDGYITEFLHNRESAAVMQTRSNAAARSTNYDREPLVRMANTFVLPGEYATEELIEDISYGIYIKTHKVANIDDKRYNLKLVGDITFLIEHGEITHPVKEPVLEITTPFFWNSVDACGRDITFIANECGKGDPVQMVHVSYGGPNVRLRNIFVR